MTSPTIDSLPSHLRDDILFRMDIKSLAMMRCTNKSFYSLISGDPSFQSEYYSRIGSGLFHISIYAAIMFCYHSLGDSMPPRTIRISKECRILGSCSGLLLLSSDGLCVVNPLTKTFRFLDQPRSTRVYLNRLAFVLGKKTMYMGLAVHQIDQVTTTQSFSIVCMTEAIHPNKTTYRFEINGGNSWKFSKVKLTCNPSDFDSRMRKPVCLDGSLHWLRNDGSIVVFNPETEKARLIPTKFPQELSLKMLFAAGDNKLTLISATEKVIDVYALEKTLIDPKWVLVRRIQNEVMTGKKQTSWNVEAYDGTCLVLRMEISSEMDRPELHGYDLRANKWGHMGSIPGWCDANLAFFLYTPSLSSVIGLDEEEGEMLACAYPRNPSLRSLIFGAGD